MDFYLSFHQTGTVELRAPQEGGACETEVYYVSDPLSRHILDPPSLYGR